MFNPFVLKTTLSVLSHGHKTVIKITKSVFTFFIQYSLTMRNKIHFQYFPFSVKGTNKEIQIKNI